MTKITEAQRAAAAAFLKTHSTLVLATLDQKTQPQAASLFYVSDAALNLYWLSDEKSAHSQNIERASRVAVAIHNETWNWRDIQGLQINGQARRLVVPDEIDRAWTLYRDKFPFASEFAERVAGSSFYICAPQWMRWINNSQGFGHREEFTLP
jgi:hypothetical protein